MVGSRTDASPCRALTSESHVEFKKLCDDRGSLELSLTGVQPADIGLPTGNGKKLSCSQLQLGQATGLAVA